MVVKQWMREVAVGSQAKMETTGEEKWSARRREMARRRADSEREEEAVRARTSKRLQ
jgi:hypothetical protein